ncbi:MAG: hypothetical protein II331_01385 [Lachnospiraceae bacterium]|nr:hypothetical protein [Lachnospiraceae bacterium]
MVKNFVKNWKKLILVCMSSTLLLSGCGATDNQEKKDDSQIKVESSDADKDKVDSQDEEGDEGFRELTQDELDEFTEFIHGWDAYGFLLSEYVNPVSVDLGEVFYSGAGVQKDMSNEDADAYLAAINESEFQTDCIKVEKSDVEKIVKERLGLSLDEVNVDNIGVYVPEFDSYYHECGDTNYVKYTCVRGLVNGNVYTLDFKADSDIYSSYSSVQTILQKTDNGYMFIANQCLSESTEDAE